MLLMTIALMLRNTRQFQYLDVKLSETQIKLTHASPMLLGKIYIQGHEGPASSIILTKSKWSVSDSLHYLHQSFQVSSIMSRSFLCYFIIMI